MGARRRNKQIGNSKLSRRLMRGNKKRTQRKIKLVQNPLFDTSKTLKENYAAIGLQLDPNQVVPVQLEEEIERIRENPQIDVEEEIDMKDLISGQLQKIQKIRKQRKEDKFDKLLEEGQEFLENEKSRRKKVNCSFDEVKVLERFMNKYGDDVERMKKDLKLNIFMWTEGQIRKKMKAYLEKKERGGTGKILGYDITA